VVRSAIVSPALTVAVCTRERPDDLSHCLTSLSRSVDTPFEVVVVDNAPPDGATVAHIVERFPGMRYLREPRPGLSRARCSAIAACGNDVIAFVDDDVQVDRGWAAALRRPFAEDRGVMAVMGLVAPTELGDEAQLRFERHGGFGRGFDRRWLQRTTEPMPSALLNTGMAGTGANMAFRRSIFDALGSFDVALGAGTPAQGGEDLEMVFRVLAAGWTVVYEPTALVWHRHRRELAELRRQIRSWGRGAFGYLTAAWLSHPAEREGIGILAAQLLAVYYPRRIAQSLVDPAIELDLTWAELVGAIAGPSHYLRGRRQVEGEASAQRPPAETSSPTGVSRTTVTVDLAETLPAALTCRSDVLDVAVNRGGRRLGELRIAAGGRDVAAARVIDAIVAHFDSRVLDPAGRTRRDLLEMRPEAVAAVDDGS
jgi:GT2 family glycosyltransferase